MDDVRHGNRPPGAESSQRPKTGDVMKKLRRGSKVEMLAVENSTVTLDVGIHIEGNNALSIA